MLIERDGSDTPPSRFFHKIELCMLAQLSRLNIIQNTKSCGAIWRNRPLLPVCSSKRHRIFLLVREPCAPPNAVAVK